MLSWGWRRALYWSYRRDTVYVCRYSDDNTFSIWFFDFLSKAKQEHWKTGLLTKAIFGWNSANTSFVEEFESTDDDEEELINEKCSSTRL
jgi:hypothetical protein